MRYEKIKKEKPKSNFSFNKGLIYLRHLKQW